MKANKRNALKSTGPRTMNGKKMSRWNSLQHGLLASAAVIEIGDNPEKKEELLSLMRELREQYKPVGAIEEILIEKIAVAYWRLRRCQLAEVGEILMASGSAWNERKTEREIDFYKKTNNPPEPGVSRYWIFRQSETGLEVLINLLKQAGQDLKDKSTIGNETERQLRIAFQGTDAMAKFIESAEPKKKRLKYIDEDLVPTLEKFKDRKYDQDRLGDAAFIKASLVPGLRSDLLLRYETGIERQMYRAINQLERLQRIRLLGYEEGKLPNEPNT